MVYFDGIVSLNAQEDDDEEEEGNGAVTIEDITELEAAKVPFLFGKTVLLPFSGTSSPLFSAAVPNFHLALSIINIKNKIRCMHSAAYITLLPPQGIWRGFPKPPKHS